MAGSGRAEDGDTMMRTAEGGVKPSNRWFGWLFSQDRRVTKRHRSLPLVAYYWDGAEPLAHGILDASLSGVYLLTKQRWYPGTVVTMTLQRARASTSDPDRSVSVNAKVVRSGTDGVGLAFLPPPQDSRGGGPDLAMRAADAKMLQRFFEQVQADQRMTA